MTLRLTLTRRCRTGYVDYPAPGVLCGECIPGFAGPQCAACSPACINGGTCIWNGAAAVCACETGYAGERCTACSVGYIGPVCLPCPAGGCGLGGTCDWNITSTQSICACNGMFQNTGDQTTPCNVCGPFGSPLTCQDCRLMNCRYFRVSWVVCLGLCVLGELCDVQCRLDVYRERRRTFVVHV